MEQIKNSSLRFGTYVPPAGTGFTNNDWTPVQKVQFPPLPPLMPGTPKQVPQTISVIVTPVIQGGAIPVPVVLKVEQNGFTFIARNVNQLSNDPSGLSFFWLAALNVQDKTPPFVDLKTAIAQPKETDRWPRLWFSTPYAAPPTLLLTENSPGLALEGTPALVGRPEPLEGINPPVNSTDGFSIRAVNVDMITGKAGFNALAIAPGNPDVPASGSNMWLDHGCELNADDYFKANALPVPNRAPYDITRGGTRGDWRSLDIYFARPFLTPPLVFATARVPLGSNVAPTPIVPVVHSVTTHGFTLAARNTDSKDGFVGFSWVALGCNAGCG